MKTRPSKEALAELLILHKMAGTCRMFLEGVPDEIRLSWDISTESYVSDLESVLEGLEAQAFVVMDELMGGGK